MQHTNSVTNYDMKAIRLHIDKIHKEERKMKKRILAIVLSTVMALSMVACGGGAAETPADTATELQQKTLQQKQKQRLQQKQLVKLSTSKY